MLDQSINGPGDVTSAIRRAIARVPNTVTAHDPVTGKLADDWLMRFTVDYAGERQLADKAHRDDWILRQHDKGWTAKWSALAPDPGSFGGWP